jgi:putative SOS response-associated peptidase YedK
VCGRYTLAGPDPSVLRGRFPLGESVQIERRYNVAPGDDVVGVIRRREHEPEGTLLRWGLVPHWAKDPKVGYRTINARAESLDERPAFRRAFERHRCLIVADGFYEWRKLDDSPRPPKQPYWVSLPDGEPFAFAGLWAGWRTPEDTWLRSCAIVTTKPNETLEPIHDRMPVILPAGAEAAWLDPAGDPDELRGLLRPLPDDLTAVRAVGNAVNDARYDGPACLEAPAGDRPADPAARLF